MKKLYVVRHAKSSWENDHGTDFDRPLNERGMSDAPLVSAYLRENEELPSIIISSPAKRAITTARIIAAEIGYPVERIQMKTELYLCFPETIIEIVQGVAGKNNSIMIVGHNPGITDVVYELCKTEIDDVSTCGVVGMETECTSWAKTGKDSFVFSFYITPKRLKSLQ